MFHVDNELLKSDILGFLWSLNEEDIKLEAAVAAAQQQMSLMTL